MRKRTAIYALYKGDEFIDLGTVDEIAARQGISIRSIQFYATSKRHKALVATKPNKYIDVVRIEDDL